MQSKRKSNTVVSHAVNGSVITFTVGPQSFDLDAQHFGKDGFWMILSDEGKAAMLHGFVQKISDRAAIGRDPETGASASPEDKFTAMKECADRLMAGGPWNATPTGSGAGAGGLLYRAMRNLYPNAWSDRVSFAAYIVEKAISESERLKTKVTEADVRNSLMRVKKIAKAMDEIRAQTGGPVLGTNDMLQELEGAGKS